MKLFWRLHQSPIVNSSTPMLLDLSAGNLEFTSAQFSTFASGGFGDGRIALKEPPDALVFAAAENWLGQMVRATDAQGRVAYEGMIAEVKAASGHHYYARSLDQFANYAYANFTYGGAYAGYGKCPKGTTCKGRVLTVETDLDATSQTAAQYGIKELWFDVGQGVISPTQAQASGQVELNDAMKKRAVDIDLATPKPNSIELALWGYWATLKFRKQSIWFGALTEIATIVQKALTVGSKAQFINTSDWTNLATTGKTIVFNKNKDAMWLQDYIQSAIECGDSVGRKLFFQIWEDRVPWLFSRLTAPRYFSRSDSDVLFDASRNPLPDYLVRAGGHIVAENADVGLDNYADVLDRPYRGLVERTDYDDLREKVRIPAPSDVLMSDERLLARAHARLARN